MIIYHFSQVLCAMHLLIFMLSFSPTFKSLLDKFPLDQKLVFTKLLFTSCSNYSQDVFFTTKYWNNQICFSSQANVQKWFFIHSIIVVCSSWKCSVKMFDVHKSILLNICGRMERFFLRNQIDGLSETTLSQKQTRYY